MRLLRFARNDEKSRIPYRDPRGKPEDDIVGNSRIPNYLCHCTTCVFLSSPDLIERSQYLSIREF